MSYAAAFDTLKFARDLEAKGFQKEQAEGLSMAMKQFFQGGSQDLKDIQDKLQEELKEAKTELATKADIEKVRAEIATSKNDILKWFVSIALAQIFAAIGLTITIINMLPAAPAG